jgi:hypothetical protein
MSVTFFFLFENSGVAAVARFENFPNQRDHEDSNGRMTFDLKIFSKVFKDPKTRFVDIFSILAKISQNFSIQQGAP